MFFNILLCWMVRSSASSIYRSDDCMLRCLTWHHIISHALKRNCNKQPFISYPYTGAEGACVQHTYTSQCCSPSRPAAPATCHHSAIHGWLAVIRLQPIAASQHWANNTYKKVSERNDDNLLCFIGWLPLLIVSLTISLRKICMHGRLRWYRHTP